MQTPRRRGRDDIGEARKRAGQPAAKLLEWEKLSRDRMSNPDSPSGDAAFATSNAHSGNGHKIVCPQHSQFTISQELEFSNAIHYLSGSLKLILIRESEANFMRALRTAIPVIAAVVFSHGPGYAAVYEDLLTYSQVDLESFMQSLAEGTGETCSNVTEAAFKGADEDDSGYFVFQCTEGTSFILRVDNDGTGKLIDCELARSMSIDCSADWANWPFGTPPENVEKPHTNQAPDEVPRRKT